MNKYQEALETIQKSKLIFHVYKGQTEGMKAPRIFDLYHGEIFTLRELVEKATPKKPKLIKDSFEDYEKCSICGMIVNYGANHCEHCGQALDWSEEE